MSEKLKPYTRLPGFKRGFIGYYSLWMGKDHLLSVYSTGFTEDYKRFYYQDIQSIIINKTIWSTIQNLIGLICGIVIIICSLIRKDLMNIFVPMAGFIFIFLLINVLLGPTCVCYLQTAVQIEKLSSLYRLKTALNAVKRIKQKINGAQGILTSEALKENLLKTKTSIAKHEELKPPEML